MAASIGHHVITVTLALETPAAHCIKSLEQKETSGSSGLCTLLVWQRKIIIWPSQLMITSSSGSTAID